MFIGLLNCGGSTPAWAVSNTSWKYFHWNWCAIQLSKLAYKIKTNQNDKPTEKYNNLLTGEKVPEY